jgi:hypothetical protein
MDVSSLRKSWTRFFAKSSSGSDFPACRIIEDVRGEHHQTGGTSLFSWCRTRCSMRGCIVSTRIRTIYLSRGLVEIIMIFVKGSGASISVVLTDKALSMARSVTIRLFMDWIFPPLPAMWTTSMVHFIYLFFIIYNAEKCSDRFIINS